MRRESPIPSHSPQISLSSGSDSNLSRGSYNNFSSTGNDIGGYTSNGIGSGGGGGREISIRKSTLLRRIWSKELRRHDARSGSWSPPLRRTHRKLHISGTSFESTLTPYERECAECKKLDEEFDSEALVKRLRLTKHATLDSNSSSQQQLNVLETPEIRDSKENLNQNRYQLPELKTATTTTVETPSCDLESNIETPLDTLRVEVESQQDNSDVTSDSGNHEQSRSETDDNISISTTICQDVNKHKNGDDKLISDILIDNLNNVIESVASETNNNIINETVSTADVSASIYSTNSINCFNNNYTNSNNNYYSINNSNNSNSQTRNTKTINNQNNKNITVDVNDNIGVEQFNKSSNNLVNTVNSVNKNRIVYEYQQVPKVYLTNDLFTDLVSNGNQNVCKAPRHFVYGEFNQDQLNYTVS